MYEIRLPLNNFFIEFAHSRKGGFRIWTNIDPIRVQPHRTNRIRIHNFSRPDTDPAPGS